MELLFTVVGQRNEGGFIVLYGSSPADGARQPREGEVLELRSPFSGKLASCMRATAVSVKTDLCDTSTSLPRPLDRSVRFASGEVAPTSDWRDFSVWSVTADGTPG
jgi:hypothetical protein